MTFLRGGGDSLSQPCSLTPHRGLAGAGQCSAPGQGYTAHFSLSLAFQSLLQQALLGLDG